MKLESIQRWEVRWMQILFCCAEWRSWGVKQQLSLALTVAGCGAQALCWQCLQLQPSSLLQLCSEVRNRGNSVCGKHKVCRSQIESSCKGTCRCWQALEIGSQHADVGCFKLGWNYYFLRFFSVKKYLSDKSYFLLDDILHADRKSVV